MMRNTLWGIVVLCSWHGASLAHGLTRYEIAERFNKSVVKIERWEIGENKPSWNGTGFFYTKTRVITNAHVIGLLAESAEEFQAIHADEDIARAIYWVLFGGKKYKARFVGRDVDLDLGILETVAEIVGVMPALLGSSDDIKSTHPVFVFGNPQGLVGSVSDGTISGRGRRFGLVAYEDYFQTSAPINSGNSGGPMVSGETGEVIGIVNSKYQLSDGLGFAIPINVFHDAEPDILQGTVRRSWVGIQFPFEETFTDIGEFQVLRSINTLTGIDHLETLQNIWKEIFKDRGVLISDVMQREVPYFNNRLKCASDLWSGDVGDLLPPAKKARLRIGDIIKKFNGQVITGSRELIYAIFHSKPCEQAAVHIVRFTEEGAREEHDVSLVPILRNPKGISAGFY